MCHRKFFLETSQVILILPKLVILSHYVVDNNWSILPTSFSEYLSLHFTLPLAAGLYKYHYKDMWGNRLLMTLMPDEETMKKVFLLLPSKIRSCGIWFIPYIAYGELLIQGLTQTLKRYPKSLQVGFPHELPQAHDGFPQHPEPLCWRVVAHFSLRFLPLIRGVAWAAVPFHSSDNCVTFIGNPDSGSDLVHISAASGYKMKVRRLRLTLNKAQV